MYAPRAPNTFRVFAHTWWMKFILCNKDVYTSHPSWIVGCLGMRVTLGRSERWPDTVLAVECLLVYRKDIAAQTDCVTMALSSPENKPHK